jgi:hypothetical protein
MFRSTPREARRMHEVLADLRALGVGAHGHEVDGFRIVIPETLGLSAGAWSATASEGAQPVRAFDRNGATRWSTGVEQRPGQWFKVDLGSAHSVARVGAWFGAGDEPRGMRIEGSLDGTRWELLVEERSPAVRWSAPIAPRKLRFVKLVQLGSAPGRWWSIRELFLFSEGGLVAGG